MHTFKGFVTKELAHAIEGWLHKFETPMLGERLLYYMLTHCLCLQACFTCVQMYTDVCRAVLFKQLSFPFVGSILT